MPFQSMSCPRPRCSPDLQTTTQVHAKLCKKERHVRHSPRNRHHVGPATRPDRFTRASGDGPSREPPDTGASDRETMQKRASCASFPVVSTDDGRSRDPIPGAPRISRRRPRSTRNIAKMIVMCVIPREIATMLDPPQGRIALSGPAATVCPGNLPIPARATAKQCKIERHVRHVRHSTWYSPTLGGPGPCPRNSPAISRRRPRSTRNNAKMIVMCVMHLVRRTWREKFACPVTAARCPLFVGTLMGALMLAGRRTMRPGESPTGSRP